MMEALNDLDNMGSSPAHATAKTKKPATAQTRATAIASLSAAHLAAALAVCGASIFTAQNTKFFPGSSTVQCATPGMM
jgi:hypothetical protein